jgi:hypothetical protein
LFPTGIYVQPMLSFACGHCGHLVFFENTRCLNCSTPQGFVPERLELVALKGDAVAELHRCANQTLAGCNWMVETVHTLCRSCELTRVRPNDADTVGLAEFARAEAAKRRAIFQLLDLGLPGVQPGQLAFALLSSEHQPVTTGHADGVITIDLAESDDARREQRRSELDEPYRTMLGHIRHELGHYFQPLVVRGDDERAACRELFGDEREDYGAALERHYEQALEAAPQPEAGERGFDEVLDNWLPLTYALNAVNRSMGLDDLYPFTLAEPVIEKLRFVHGRVHEHARPVVA